MNVSLTKKIIFLFLGVIIFPLIITLHIVDREVKKITYNENRQKLIFALDIVENYLDGKRLELQIQAKKISEELDRKLDIDKNVINRYKEHYALTGILYIDEHKNIISSGNVSFISNDLLNKLLDFAKSNQWKAMLIDKDSSLIFFAEAPLFNRKSVVILVKKNPDNFLDFLYEIVKINVSLFDDKGNLISTTLYNNSTGKRSKKGLNKDIVSVLKNNPSIIKYDNGELLAYRIISIDDNKKIILKISLPDKAISKVNQLLFRSLLIVTMVAIILAILLALKLANDIIIPLKMFVNAALKIADGNFDYRVKLKRNDEIGILVDVFNDMAKRLENTYQVLKRRLFEISTLYKISQLVNEVNNSEELLKRILEETCKALESEKASIYLLSPQTDVLEMRMVYGVNDNVKQRVYLKIGEGIAGKVLLSGDGIIVNEGNRHPDFYNPDNNEAKYNIRNLMCVPLKIKDNVFGVINVSNKKEGRIYTENDLKLLKALASQISINIENTKLYELSITDGLTKLYIHRHFQIRLEEEIIRARRYNSRVSLLLMDIDHFKNFNDTYGHQIGDLVLIKVAEIISNTIRNNIDIAARYGGEEFTVIAPEQSEEEAAQMAERLRKAIEKEPLKTEKYGELKITVSIGVACYPVHAKNKVDLIGKADKALYVAKEKGRNRVVVWNKNM